MVKPVRNTGEGILGAIKAVTHKPVVTSFDNQKPTNVPGSLKGSKENAKKLPSANPNIEASRTAKKLPASNNKIKDKEARLPPSTAGASGLPDRVGTATSVSSKSAKLLSQGVKKPLSYTNLETRSVELAKVKKKAPPIQTKPETTQRTKAPSRNDPDAEQVLPSGRPASINREIDSALDSFNMDPKSSDYIIERVRSHISANLIQATKGDICKPDVSVAGPVFQALQHSYHRPQIVMLYANLLSTAMMGKTARFAHPGFVDLIRNITEDEARVLTWFYEHKVLPVIDIKKVMVKKQSEMRLNTLVSSIAQEAGCEFDDLAEGYLANLERIGLLEIPRTTCLTDDDLYKSVLAIAAVEEKLNMLNTGSKDFRGEVVKYYAKLSVYGIKFCHACLR